MGRKVKPDEKALWEQVADTTIPMHRAKAELEMETIFNPKPIKTAPKHKPILPFKIGSKATGKTAVPKASVSAPVMDSKSFGKLTRGKMRPEAKIDLHGMTMAEAHPALMDFILGSAQLQRRLVLVITGKGKSKPDFGPIPERMGVLRHHVPGWLRQAPLAQHILEITSSHQRHGGAGALYVYLRRRR